jgi:DnaJ homolog subfamily C member 2
MPADGKANEVLSTMSIQPELAKRPEQAGWLFSKLQLKHWKIKMRADLKAGKTVDEHGNPIVVEDSEDDTAQATSAVDTKYKASRTRQEFIKCALEEDYYGVLDLVPFTMPFYDEEEIEKQYRRQAVAFHPDKNGDAATEKDKQIWLAIQSARDTLIDINKRRRYDSTLAFDDSIPKPETFKSDDDFYKQFDECFERNARFAENWPAPRIGNKDTPMEEVRNFYRYWDNFKTWREFSQFDEHDPTKAQDRYEKRWMEKENKKEREKHAKLERKRLIKLAETAYDNDPRIQAIIRKEKEEKEALKKSKQDIKQKKHKEQEAKAKAESEAAAKEKEAAAAAAKIAKEAKKLAGQKYRATVKDLITICVENMPETNYDKFYVDELVKRYPQQEQLDELISQVKAIGSQPSVAEFVSKFLDLVETEADKQKRLEKEESARRQEEERLAKLNQTVKEWTPEEVALLTKGITKFPPGTVNRWKVIADFVQSKNQKEVIQKAKEIQEKQA